MQGRDVKIKVRTSQFIENGDENTSKGIKQEIIYNLGADPQTIDPLLNTAIDGSNVIVNAFECLMVLNDKNEAANCKYFVSDINEQFSKIAGEFLKRDIKDIEKVEIQKY